MKQKQQNKKGQRSEKVHSQQLCPKDHGHLLAGVVATETQAEKMVAASLLGAQHAGRAPDRGQVEVLGLAGAHPDLISEGVVDHGVALLAGRHRKPHS